MYHSWDIFIAYFDDLQESSLHLLKFSWVSWLLYLLLRSCRSLYLWFHLCEIVYHLFLNLELPLTTALDILLWFGVRCWLDYGYCRIFFLSLGFQLWYLDWLLSYGVIVFILCIIVFPTLLFSLLISLHRLNNRCLTNILHFLLSNPSIRSITFLQYFFPSISQLSPK